MPETSPGFTCNKCGKCCKGFSEERGVSIWPSDAARISNQLGLEKATFLTTYCDAKEIEINKGTVTIHLLKSIEGNCIFLSEENLCTIHDFKPVQCVKTPFDFFWDRLQPPPYECLENIDLPLDWDTSESDNLLIESLEIKNK